MPEEPEQVAVIVPSHNQQRVLRACVESVLVQTHRPAEVIVVDDASTDGSRELARALCDASQQDEDPPLCTLVELPGGGGAAAARNAGVAASNAPILFFLDAGTVLAPDAIQNALRTLRDSAGRNLVQGIPGPRPAGDGGPVERYRVVAESFTRREGAETRFPYSLIPRESYLEAGGLDEQAPYRAKTDSDPRMTAGHPLVATSTVVCQADDVNRLLPWLKIAFRRGSVTADLACRAWSGRRAARWPSRPSHPERLAKLSTGLLLLSLLVVPLGPVAPWLLALPLLLTVTTFVAGHEVLRSAYRMWGVRYALLVAGIHLLTHGTFVIGATVGVLRWVGRTKPRWRRAAWWLLGVAFVVALVATLGSVLAQQDWTVVTTALGQQDRGRLWLLVGGAALTASIGLIPGVAAWGAVLLDLGPPVRYAHVVRIFFVFFLMRYLPRGVGLLATVAAAKAGGVTFGRLVSSMLMNVGVVAMTGLTIGTAAGMHILGPQGGWLALAPILTAILLIRPQLVNKGIRSLARVLRRPEPKRPVSARGMRLAVAAQSLSWLVSGLHLWLLAILMGAPPVASLALCVGAYSLAVAVGMLAIVVPDGIGIREAILTGALAVVLPLPAAVAVTLASRLITVLTDAIVGAIALTVTEIARRREPGHPGESRPATSSPDVQSAQPASQDEQATTR